MYSIKIPPMLPGMPKGAPVNWDWFKWVRKVDLTKKGGWAFEGKFIWGSKSPCAVTVSLPAGAVIVGKYQGKDQWGYAAYVVDVDPKGTVSALSMISHSGTVSGSFQKLLMDVLKACKRSESVGSTPDDDRKKVKVQRATAEVPTDYSMFNALLTSNLATQFASHGINDPRKREEIANIVGGYLVKLLPSAVVASMKLYDQEVPK